MTLTSSPFTRSIQTVKDSEKAGSGQKLKTEDGCAIADWREQSSDTRDWVAG